MNYVEKFKEKGALRHANKYDYSLVVECDSKTPVDIICPAHGVFSQRKDVHLKGGGCKKCLFESIPPKRTMKETVKLLSLIHDFKYDYSLLHTSKVTEKVSIICHKHGIFEQTISHHRLSTGCPQCSYEEYMLTTEEFLEIAKKTHGDTYDYSLVSLTKGFKQKVDILCRKHGVFNQVAGTHMYKNGCPKCGNERAIQGKYSEYTTELFIEKAVKAHGDRYSYELSEYVNTETKIKIICKVHGIFEQRPSCHTRGKGCAKCRNDNTTYNFIQKYRDNPELGSKEGKIYILEIFDENEKFLKLGITSDKVGRFKKYRADFKKVGYGFKIIFESETTNYISAMAENDILKEMRIGNYIYTPSKNFSGKSECLIPQSLDVILEMIPLKVREYEQR